MPDISLRLGPVVDAADFEKVRATIPRLEKGDHLIIALEASDAHQADNLIELLEDYGLDYQSRGSHDGSTYYLIATPKSR
ncbi:MAG: hypothetical protein PWP65_2160 [Clostridia bacterium]|nr:hypothetical protein [Clostridia bacterium]